MAHTDDMARTTTKRPEPLDIVGPEELLDITTANSKRTVYVWRERGLLPEPDARVSGVPIWRRATIVQWARDCGRLRQ